MACVREVSSFREACVNEACADGLAEGAKLTPQPILAALEGAPDALRSSMQKDVAAGRAPELDAIAGPILRGGDEHGIDVSATQALVDRIESSVKVRRTHNAASEGS